MESPSVVGAGLIRRKRPSEGCDNVGANRNSFSYDNSGNIERHERLIGAMEKWGAGDEISIELYVPQNWQTETSKAYFYKNGNLQKFYLCNIPKNIAFANLMGKKLAMCSFS
ncbi:uncharacterized protein MONOS_3263 [Monocercomonoides exilis]|uniref:uncharacterized protein n=1 Tax=Monocercomonoides exilis TaxID=2049356 RepID=UPI00355A0DF4|nr:hypothetical protein MONOS_3263 [Monocercomonoides exilis]|eukprot:MONOS_3263.1-p1 / transcript=MONOS_3263.1 / gene=MONOS_3263 / organism=Monocercomonoides_exilis_PA203 / gene_product=unspecified product / transcript_product=unspecified product / location=Mono_scaffold00075:98059-98936(+) / protein_length=112 / sequence_SO=supercontig / SO=protein_coding / is_pseudo=false